MIQTTLRYDQVEERLVNVVTKSRKSSAKFSFDAENEEKNDEEKICDVKARVHQLHSFCSGTVLRIII